MYVYVPTCTCITNAKHKHIHVHASGLLKTKYHNNDTRTVELRYSIGTSKVWLD